MSGLCSLIASTNFSGATCTPRSMTWKPAPSNMMLTRFLPMSCTSPLTVPITIVPIVCGAGLGQQRAQDLQRAGHRLAGDEHLGHEEVAALEPGAHLFQRRDQRLVQQLSGPRPMARPWLVSSSTAGPVADQRVVVELAEQLFAGHAAPPIARSPCLPGLPSRPAGGSRGPRTGPRPRPRSARPPRPAGPWSSCWSGPRPTAPRPPRRRSRGSGAATAIRPGSSSSSVTA